MDGEAVKEIERLAKAGLLTSTRVDGVEVKTPLVSPEEGHHLSTIPLHDIRKAEPVAPPVELSTLSGLADYVNFNRDQVKLEGCLVHVASPTLVVLQGPLFGHFQQRHVYARVTAPNRMKATEFSFGRYQELEALVVALMALFHVKPGRDAVLQLLAGVKEEEVRTSMDDGISQEVTARQGIALVGSAKVPNPVSLAPFRTFAEVDQPESLFILRLRKGGSGRLEGAIFEADGGAWQLEAMENVARFLRTTLPSGGPAVLE